MKRASNQRKRGNRLKGTKPASAQQAMSKPLGTIAASAIERETREMVEYFRKKMEQTLFSSPMSNDNVILELPNPADPDARDLYEVSIQLGGEPQEVRGPIVFEGHFTYLITVNPGTYWTFHRRKAQTDSYYDARVSFHASKEPEGPEKLKMGRKGRW